MGKLRKIGGNLGGKWDQFAEIWGKIGENGLKTVGNLGKIMEIWVKFGGK